MLPEGSIRVQQIWKRFRPDLRRRSLRDELPRLRGRIGGGPDRWRWALRDVFLTAEPGDAIGLVGRNGSGKSTLLKILAQVMVPYAGYVEVVGRVGALIEVRAGIHPELTGKENVYLYGTLLGLRRQQVAKRFDDIVGFAELESAIDRQVKFYSSGMQMRLGFSVAAHLDPDILLVDEVLAVGDAAFQQRCLARMRDVLDLGTTLIYVSHDLPSVEAVCATGLWLDDGRVAAAGPVREALGAYRQAMESTEIGLSNGSMLRPLKVSVSGPALGPVATEQSLEIKIILESEIEQAARVHLGITEGTANPVLAFSRDVHLPEGQTEVKCSVPRLPLPRGRFFLWLGVNDQKRTRLQLLPWRPVARFDVIGPDLDTPPGAVFRLAPVYTEVTWESGPI